MLMDEGLGYINVENKVPTTPPRQGDGKGSVVPPPASYNLVVGK